LSAIAAAAAGGVPQKRIGRVLSEIAPALVSLHAKGKVHGAISVHTVGLDEFGHAHLLVPALYPDHPGSMEPASCFAAAEQFDPDPAQACGPWTDVYALCAVMCSLVSGSPPPHALARRAQDHYVPLATRQPPGYEEAFLSVIDQGLSLGPSQRPPSVAALCEALAVPYMPEPQESIAVETGGAAAATGIRGPGAYVRGDRPRRPARLLAMAAGVLVAAGVWLWLTQDNSPDGAWSDGAVIASRPAPVQPAPPDMSGDGLLAEPDAAPGAIAPLADSGAKTDTEPDIWGRVPDLPAPPEPSSSSADSADTPDSGAEPANPPAAGEAAAPSAKGEAGTEEGATHAARTARAARVAVKVDVRPWGEIFVDGVSRGVSPPLKSFTLPAGRHTIEVRNANLPPYRASVDLKGGQPYTVRHVFQ
jgi:hypothetical protein